MLSQAFQCNQLSGSRVNPDELYLPASFHKIPWRFYQVKSGHERMTKRLTRHEIDQKQENCGWYYDCSNLDSPDGFVSSVDVQSGQVG